MNTRRVAVVSGASSGIGLETAKMLVGQGWHVIGLGKNAERSRAAAAEIEQARDEEGKIDFLRGDLAEIAAARRLAGEILAITSDLHVLINNAGGVRDGYYVTKEGHESTFAANHLGAFALTLGLLPLLRSTVRRCPEGTVRVIAVSSLAHHMCQAMNWDDPGFRESFDANAAYCQAKLANLLFIKAFATRYSDDGIVAQAMHPGRVASNFASHGNALLQDHMAAADCDPPRRPAETLVWMATAVEAGSAPGRLFYDKAEAEMAPQAKDDFAAARLWDMSEAMVAAT